MVYIMAKEYTDMVAAPTEYYFNVIIRGYLNNSIITLPLEIAYSECVLNLKN